MPTSLSGFIPRHIEQPAPRHSKPASVKTRSRPRASAALLTAVAEGLGFAILRWTLAASELQSGRLALASETVLPHRFAYYFVCPQSYIALPKVAGLRDWLVQQAAAFSAPPQSAESSRQRRAKDKR